ncbi:bifunctional folylpolyglutamate synthetase/dihydrofolate synthetase [uncultured Thiomicrorhabdus sp.]
MSAVSKPSANSSVNEWVDWLLQLHAQEIDLGLERVHSVAERMQILRPAPKVITVAGTNGKGSTVAMLVSVLKAAGLNVGAYTSPHIQNFNERIQINGVPVADERISESFADIELSRAATKLTYFEFSTLAALHIFSNTDLDVVVLEVGLGGRLDAVNIVDADAVIITAIDIDHIEWLGDDRGQIAIEKAGVTRSGHLAVCSDPNPPETLFDYCVRHKVPLHRLGVDYSYQLAEDKKTWCLTRQSGSCFDLPLPSLKGDFQLQNASGVVALLVAMQEAGDLAISSEHLQEALPKGLVQASHPGRLQSLRFEFAGKRFHWLIDVAHNPQSAQVLATYLEQCKLNNLQALFSVLDDKDSLPMVKKIAPFVTHWTVADLQIPRAAGLQKLQSILVDADVAAEQVTAEESLAKYWKDYCR